MAIDTLLARGNHKDWFRWYAAPTPGLLIRRKGECLNAPIRRQLLPAVLALIALSLSPCPTNAHHSGAMFDSTRTVTLQGTVRAFQWTNPHSFIQLVVEGPNGAQEWSIEMGSPSQLYRSGWRPSSIRVGERLTVLINPLRDGTSGGVFVSATAADGQPVGAPRTDGASR